MVKSRRYAQKTRDTTSNAADIGRLRRAGHTDADANSNGDPASDRDTTPHGHADAHFDLSAAEPRGSLDAACPV